MKPSSPKPSILASKATHHVGFGLAVVGLLLVCVCFFLPWDRRLGPDSQTYHDVAPADEALWMIFLPFNPYLLAFALAGLLLLGAALGRRWRRVVGGVVLILSLVFHELVYFGDTFSIQRARDRLKEREGDRVFQKYMSVSHPAFMPYQAAKVAFIDSDKDRARELIEQTRILNRFQLNPEEERSVTVMLDKLERRMYAVSQEGAASPDVAASPDAGNPDTSNPDEVPNDSLS